jgi:ABC-type multidrug transport system fused ATPase/permease subunit
MLNFDAAQRWLALRIELLGSTITLSVCAFVVCANGTLMLSAGLVGFLIMWSIVFTTSLGFLLQHFTETEARITAIERVNATSALPQEAAWDTNPTLQLNPSWPSQGQLRFDNVSLRYRKELPLALDSVSFQIPAGTSCGVVGRYVIAALLKPILALVCQLCYLDANLLDPTNHTPPGPAPERAL